MNGEYFEKNGAGEQGAQKESGLDAPNSGYEQYKALGGIINEKDYESAITRSKNVTAPDKALITQTESIAETAGVELHNTKDSLDPRVVLYGILRNDTHPEGVKYHHSQMSDQRLFAEALRMLGDTESLNKVVGAYPNITF